MTIKRITLTPKDSFDSFSSLTRRVRVRLSRVTTLSELFLINRCSAAICVFMLEVRSCNRERIQCRRINNRKRTSLKPSLQSQEQKRNLSYLMLMVVNDEWSRFSGIDMILGLRDFYWYEANIDFVYRFWWNRCCCANVDFSPALFRIGVWGSDWKLVALCHGGRNTNTNTAGSIRVRYENAMEHQRRWIVSIVLQ